MATDSTDQPTGRQHVGGMDTGRPVGEFDPAGADEAVQAALGRNVKAIIDHLRAEATGEVLDAATGAAVLAAMDRMTEAAGPARWPNVRADVYATPTAAVADAERALSDKVPMAELIERSSMGAPEAKAMRAVGAAAVDRTLVRAFGEGRGGDGPLEERLAAARRMESGGLREGNLDAALADAREDLDAANDALDRTARRDPGMTPTADVDPEPPHPADPGPGIGGP